MTNRELAAHLEGSLVGEERSIEALVPIGAPRPGAVTIATDAAAAAGLGTAAAGLAALILPAEMEVALPCPLIRVRDPRLALARLTALFDRRPRQESGVHASAVVADDAILGEGAAVGARAVIGAGVRLGPGAEVGPGCVLGPGTILGANCRLHANVTLYDGVVLGERVTLHSGVSVGQDGFGYAAGPRGALKIHHLSGVVIGDDVEIGAGTVIDRGTLSPTRIGARSKIGNLCLIAHNVEIGSDCLLTGMIAVGGSARLGDGVMVGGGAVLRDHVRLGDGARLAGGSGLGKDVPAGATWGGAPARPFRQWVRGLYLQERLEEIWSFVKARR